MTERARSILFVLVGTVLLVLSVFAHQWWPGQGIFGDDHGDPGGGVIAMFALITLLFVFVYGIAAVWLRSSLTIRVCIVTTLLMMLWLVCLGFDVGAEHHHDKSQPLGAGFATGIAGCVCVLIGASTVRPRPRSAWTDEQQG
jgi:hypothetical protein